MQTTERNASAGLDIAAYARQWGRAQTLALAVHRNRDGSILAFWENARRLYLELGGQLLRPLSKRLT